jgi:hypothetical protein
MYQLMHHHATAVRVTDVTGADLDKTGTAIPRRPGRSGSFHCVRAELSPHCASE